MKRTILLISGTLLAFSASAHAVQILAPGSNWEYTFTDPTGFPGWNTTTGIDPLFPQAGPAPFGNVAGQVGNWPGFQTFWPADAADGDDLWVRTSIDLTGFDLTTITWDLGVDNGYTLYANGNLVSAANAEGYTFQWEYSGSFAAASLNQGVNVIAVALEDHGGLTAFDMQINGTRTTRPVPDGAQTAVLLALSLLGLIALSHGLRRARA